MKTPTEVRELILDATCTSITLNQFNELMNGATKANGRQIRRLIKKHLPLLHEELALDYYNPFENLSQKTKTHLIYVHSGIEFFILYR